MRYLFSDPRPELFEDTARWNRLFKLIPKLEDKVRAARLHTTLWSMRNAGTQLKDYRDGLRLAPIIGEGWVWDSEAEFEEMKKKHLSEFRDEITSLLNQIVES